MYTSYQKSFRNIKEKYKLKGQIKVVSNVMCELLITSDKEFFELIGEEETKVISSVLINSLPIIKI